METHELPPLDPKTHPVLPVEDAGRYLGVGRSTAYNCAKAGEIPTIRLGRRLVLPTAALMKMLGQGDTPPDLRGNDLETQTPRRSEG